MVEKKSHRLKQRKHKSASPGAGDAPRKGWVVLIAVLAVACLTAVVFLILKPFRGRETKPAEGVLESEFVKKELKIEESAKAYNERAVEVAQRLVKEFPGRAEPIFLLGQVYYEQERYGEAAKFWEDGLKIDSSQPAAYQAMGLMALEEGNHETAVSHWRKALEVDPNWPGARRAIGLALMQLGRVPDAVPELEADLKESPNNPQTHFLLGQAAFQLDKLDEAKKHYEAAIRSSSRFTGAYYGLSRTLMRLGKSEEAKDPLEKFKELKAGERKAKREGEEAYDDMLSQRNMLAAAYDRAGMICLTYGDGEKAADYFRIAARLDPMNAEPHLHLANFHARRGETQKAIREYEEVRRLRPQDVRSYLPLGILYARSGRLSEAEESLRTVIQFAPDHPVGYRELANLYITARTKLKEAEALARKAITLDESAANYDLLGWACYLNRNLADADAAASRAVELEPGNLTYRNHYETIRSGK